MSGSSKRKHSSDDDDALRELISSILSGRYKEETYLGDVSSVCRARPESAPRLLALIDRYKRLGRMPAAQHQKVKARIEQAIFANRPASSPASSKQSAAAIPELVDEEDIDGIDIDVEPQDDSDLGDDLSEDANTREFPARPIPGLVRTRGAAPIRVVPPPAPAPAPALTATPPPPTLIVAPVAPVVIAPAPIAATPMSPAADLSSSVTRVISDATLLIPQVARAAAPPKAASPAAVPAKSAPKPTREPAVDAAVAPTAAVSIGADTVLHDRYELCQLLGRGGIATVYKAVDRYRVNLGLEDCYVAVKIVQPHPSRPGSVAALGREFHNAQLLSHPNVINVFNIDHAGDASYYTMELLNGERLSALIKRVGLLPRPYALAIIRDIGAAIAHAHSRGVVHADLKPHNIMITSVGQVRVLDFGSGMIRAREPWISEMSPDDNYRQATPAYASCEQLEGWSADPRDDIYALACLAYLLLTGKHPFDLQPSLDARARRMQPRRPPNLSGESWRALRRGLAWTREQRTMAVEDWMKDLGVGAAASSLPPLSLLRAAKPYNVWLHRAAAAGLLVAALGLTAFTVEYRHDFEWQPALVKAQSRLNDAWKGFTTMLGSSDTTASAATITPAIIAPAPIAVPPAPSRKSSLRNASTVPARGSHSASEPVGDSTNAASIEEPQKVAMVAPVVTPDSSEAAATGAPLQFSAASYIVPGAEPAARITIRRNGSTEGDVNFVWWTEEGSAKADVDYASLGRRVERIPSGTDKITVYVPIISNPGRRDSTQFYVALGEPGSYRSTGPGTRSLVTIDHGT